MIPDDQLIRNTPRDRVWLLRGRVSRPQVGYDKT